MAQKRYLASRVIDDEFDESPAGGFVLNVKPGDEIDLDDDLYDLVNAKYLGALMEMDPQTKRDWDD